MPTAPCERANEGQDGAVNAIQVGQMIDQRFGRLEKLIMHLGPPMAQDPGLGDYQEEDESLEGEVEKRKIQEGEKETEIERKSARLSHQ